MHIIIVSGQIETWLSLVKDHKRTLLLWRTSTPCDFLFMSQEMSLLPRQWCRELRLVTGLAMDVEHHVYFWGIPEGFLTCTRFRHIPNNLKHVKHSARIRVPAEEQGHMYFSYFISMVKVAMMEELKSSRSPVASICDCPLHEILQSNCTYSYIERRLWKDTDTPGKQWHGHRWVNAAGSFSPRGDFCKRPTGDGRSLFFAAWGSVNVCSLISSKERKPFPRPRPHFSERTPKKNLDNNKVASKVE